MNIKEPAPNLVTKEAMVADKIASIAVPQTQNSIWDAFKEAQYGEPTAPMGSAGIAARISEPQGTTNLKKLQNQLTMDTTRVGLKLPNLGGPPARGQATAMQHRHLNDKQYQEVSGGIGSAANRGNTAFVDDKGWPVTLKQIIGSRMLTQDQLAKASIANVRKLLPSVTGGTQQERDEVHFMFQRMMLEGFIRGVDITKDIEKNGAPKIKLYDYSALGVAKHSGARNTETVLDLPFWRKSDEMNKYMLFVHEFGHQLLNKSHYGIGAKANDGGPRGIMNQRVNHLNAKDMLSSTGKYNALMDDLFSSRYSKSYNHLKINKTAPGQGTDKYDASWFPQISGADAGYSTPGGNNSGAGTPDKPADPFSNDPNGRGNGVGGGFFNSETHEYNISPNEVGGGSNANPTITAGGGGGGRLAGASAVVGGELSASVMNPTKSFAAGMANLGSGGGGAVDGGTLLRSG